MSDFLSVEEWRYIPGTQGYYEASSSGRLRRSRPGRSTFAGKLVVGYPDKKNYLRATLTGPFGVMRVSFHRAVAEAFGLPRRRDDTLIRHLNGDKQDNRPANLKWGTIADNARDEVTSGRSKLRASRNREKTHCPQGHEYTDENTYVDTLNRRSCRTCHREKEKQAADAGLKTDDPRHGTSYAYLSFRCRCVPCKTAYSLYAKERRKNNSTSDRLKREVEGGGRGEIDNH